MADSIRFGIVGFGNIGAGVVDVFTRNRDVINARLPRPLALVRLADQDLKTPRSVAVPEGVELTDDADRVLRADDVDVVVELIGGLKPARQFVETALRAGKHVVTANKALLADAGPDLWNLAEQCGVSLLFEAAVGGGIPIIRALEQGLAANEITAVRGILNGTCNYILTRMTAEGIGYEEVLADAQRLGYAEPDPTFDVAGYDTAQKIAILASLAFAQDVRFTDVAAEGITEIRAEDLALAAANGYAVKLVATARRDAPGEPAEIHVHPTLLPRESSLGRVDDVINAVEVVGNAVGSVTLVGPGAGPAPTASAVLSDVMNLAQQIADGGASLDRRLRVPVGEGRVRPFKELAFPFALILSVQRGPDAVARVLAAAAEASVEIARVIEHGAETSDAVGLMIFTERSAEATIQDAVERIAALDITVAPPSALRVEETP